MGSEHLHSFDIGGCGFFTTTSKITTHGILRFWPVNFAMEVLGGATAILTIAIEFHDVCKKLNRFIKNVKNAHNEVEIIAHEAETFALLLQRFGKTMRTADLPEGGFLVDLDSNNISDNIVQASKVIGDKIRHLLKKSEPLRLDKPEYSQFTRWFTLLKWSSWKEEWSQIHLFLVSTKVDAELLISMINFETLMNHIRALRTNHREVPEDLKQELYVFNDPRRSHALT